MEKIVVAEDFYPQPAVALGRMPAEVVAMVAQAVPLWVLEELAPAERALGNELLRNETARTLVAAAGRPAGTAPAVQAVAYVNHSRWVVDCPFCNSAQIASPDDRRFVCCDCLNATVAGRFVEVVWPAAAERAQIEQLLLARGGVANRNWSPGETAAELRLENAAHGVR